MEYTFAPAGDALLFPLNGKLYYYSLAGPKEQPAEFIDTHGFATDATVSPAGGQVAYVRDQNLYVYDIAAKKEKALTTDGGGAIKNGMAEFVAQEEMDRSTGYWWAPDGRHIAFARVDESPIKVTERFEIAADNVATFAQRYPTTGGPNVLIKLGVIDIKTGAVKWMDLGAEPRYLSGPGQLAAGRQNAGAPAREPQSAQAGSVVCGHRHGQDPYRAHRKQQHLD